MGRILALGSVHMDIIANIDRSTKKNVDKIGSLTYTVGGTAFNVAANLRHGGQNVALYSVLKAGSHSSTTITAEMGRRGISTAYIRFQRLPAESGFIAHTENGEVQSAVSCIGIQDANLDYNDIAKAINNSSLIAIDCNLATEQIHQLHKLAKKSGKPLCICAVSESKVSRIFNNKFSDSGPAFKFVILNQNELAKATAGKTAISTEELCKSFSTEYIILTKSQIGFDVIEPTARHENLKVNVEHVVSPLGAGDALYAAMCHHFSAQGKLSIEEAKEDARRFLVPVLTSKHATPVVKGPHKGPSPDRTSVLAIGALLGAVTAVVYGFFGPGLTRFTFGILLIVVAVLSGFSGCQIDLLITQEEADPFRAIDRKNAIVKQAFGVAAGVISAFLFFLPQLIGSREFQDLKQSEPVPFGLQVLIPFCFIVAFIGGLTADAILRRVKLIDISKIEPSKAERPE